MRTPQSQYNCGIMIYWMPAFRGHDRPAFNALSSIHAHAGGLDGASPFLDLALDEFLQILRRPASRRYHARDDVLEALLHHCVIHGGQRCSAKFLHDGSWGALGEKNGKPDLGFEIG